MGCAPTNVGVLLECLWALGDAVPNDPRSYDAVVRGLAHPDPEIREYAIGVAHCLGATALLRQHARREPEPWLARYSVLGMRLA